MTFHRTAPRQTAITLILSMAFSLVAFINTGWAGPKSQLLDEHWLAHDPASTITIEHDAWQTFLDLYLEVADPFDHTLEVELARSRENRRIFATYEIHDQYEVRGKHQGRRENLSRIDYHHVRPRDRQMLRDYLTRMQAVEVSRLNRPEQRAYWLNLHNALVVSIILDNYPVASVLDIDLSDEPIRRGPWPAKLISVEDRALSLDNIAHNILRPIWQDERTIYGLTCGALGCPEPSPTAFRADNIDQLLDQAAARFINHPRGAAIRAMDNRRGSLEGDGRLFTSSLYVWFAEDFGEHGSDRDVIAHLRRYADERVKPMLDRAGEIDSHDFNWHINHVE
ncbi:MAG: DUF547 domain-containing protein [Pseudomonadota bacterium]